jgi:hypothetical protein
VISCVGLAERRTGLGIVQQAGAALLAQPEAVAPDRHDVAVV